MGKKFSKSTVISTAIAAAKEYFGGYINGCKSFIEKANSMAGMFADCDDLSRKYYDGLAIDISQQELESPGGSNEEILKRQAAVKYAGVCEYAAQSLEKMSAEVNKLQSDFFAFDDGYNSQFIRIYPGQYSASNEVTLANMKIFKSHYGKPDYKSILTHGAMSESLSAEEAQEKFIALNAAGIKAKIYSKKVDEWVRKDRQQEVIDYFNRKENIENNKKKKKKRTKDYIFFEDHVGYTEACGSLSFILTLIGVLLLILGRGYAGYVVLVIAGVVLLSIVVTFVCDKIYEAYIDHDKYARERSMMFNNARKIDVAVREYYYEVVNAIQEEVMADVYTWRQMTYEVINKVRAEIEQRKMVNKQVCANVTSYIPSNVSRWLLLKAAEIMDKNRFVDLNTAIMVAQQSGYINVATENYSEFKTVMLGYLAEIPKMKRRLGK